MTTKRAAEPLIDTISKRQRVDGDNVSGGDPLFQPLRKATDISYHGCDEVGCLEGRVHMKWPVQSGKLRILMETSENGKPTRFAVVFIDNCLVTLLSSGVQFYVGDVFQLSLKGAARVLSKASRENTLPMELLYREGIALRFLTRKNAVPLLSVNTFKASAPQHNVADAPNPAQEDWFSTQEITKRPTESLSPSPPSQHETNSDLARKASNVTVPVGREHSSSELAHETRGSSNNSEDPSLQRHASAVGTAMQYGPEFSEKLSKKADKKARREQRKKLREENEKTAAEQAVPYIPSLEPNNGRDMAVEQSPVEDPHGKQPVMQSRERSSLSRVPIHPFHTPVSSPRQHTPSPAVHHIVSGMNYNPQMSNSHTRTTQQKGSSTEDPAQTRCVLPNGLVYTPLNSLCPDGQYQTSVMRHVIGIVLNAEAMKHTTSGEYSRKVTLVDPSMWDSDIERGRSINCFSKTPELNIPDDISRGDILLLRNIMVKDYKGNTQCLAPSFKQWTCAVVDLKTLRWRRDDSSNSITRFEPCAEEIQYCIRLNDWWQDIEKQQKQFGENTVVHNLADASGFAAATNQKQGRVHRLIKDTTPESEPQGYFDCTVEVLYKYENQGGFAPMSLYVTDYTRNEMVAPQQPEWCPPSLADRVFQIEMWDRAKEEAMVIEPGQYYLLRNVRMKRSSGGYFEGKMAENKVTRLDVDEVDESPRLAELLQRKTEWQRSVQDQTENQFPHKLLEEADADKFFRCTVEILGLSHKGDDRSYLYVTDYTSRADFAPVWFEKQPECTVGDDRVLKVHLRGDQAKTSTSLKPGDYVALRNIRLRKNEKDKLAGQLGGSERLIFKLNPATTGNEDLIALLRRKEEWNNALEAKKNAVANSKMYTETKTGCKQDGKALKARPSGTVTIKDILSCTRKFGRFRVRARIIDSMPTELDDFVVLHCTQCGEDVEKPHKVCPECLEENDIVLRYQFVFVIEDEDGHTLPVVVNRNENSLLHGLEPADFSIDFGASEEFRQRLAPIIGNLEEVHLARSRRKDLKPEAPFVIFEIGTWEIADGERGYIFLNHCRSLN